MFAVFRGYLSWDAKRKRWNEDEWLTQIYASLREAKDAVMQFAEGHPFDNDRELQVTRYFGKSADPFNRGKELSKGDQRIVLYEWMRYAVFQVNG